MPKDLYFVAVKVFLEDGKGNLLKHTNKLENVGMSRK